jgi:hypothetical protein
MKPELATKYKLPLVIVLLANIAQLAGSLKFKAFFKT